MKNTKKTESIATTPTPKKTSLFDSIVDNEKLQEKELECQRLANRVGLIKKILVNRNLDALSWEFDYKINDIVQNFATLIDNELHPTKEDKEPSL